MERNRHAALVYGILLLAWTLVLGWQAAEHVRVEHATRAALVERARDISTTVGIVLRAQRRFGGVISRERVESALSDLVKASDLNGLALLNATGSVVVSSGSLAGADPGQSVHWDGPVVSVMNLVDLGTNVTRDIEPPAPPIILSREEFFRPGDTNRVETSRLQPPVPDESVTTGRPPAVAESNVLAIPRPAEPPRTRNRGEPRPGRPPWMGEAEYKALLQKQGAHSFLVVLSTHAAQDAIGRDFWMRGLVVLLAALAAGGVALAWRNFGKSSELQLRLVRASELAAHSREMNLAAAGLAHETRNPLNIVRGLAQMISRRPDAPEEIREKSRVIVDEADKVAVQLNEFIDYSRPRAVRRAAVPLQQAVRELVQTLSYDIEEKQVRVEIIGEPLVIEADERLLRQALFNLLLNAIQAVDRGGAIRIATMHLSAHEAAWEIRDDGPGVSSENRQEIFKPYFTTTRGGTGLGLAVVQQIVLAHGWDIACLPNEPHGAVFRISHLQLAAKK